MSSENTLVIIGGGSAGLGVAKALLGNTKIDKIYLIEKDKLSTHTSNNSLRIIHGGFRYLQKVDLIRVMESLHDQEKLLKAYPSHIKKLQCIMPLKKFGIKSKYPMICAAILYNTISLLITGHTNGARVKKISSYENEIDIIKNKNEYALFWNDALLLSPLDFASALKDELKDNVNILEDNEVVDIKGEDGEYKITTKDKESSEEKIITSKYLINTTGPWLNKLDSKFRNEFKSYKWCKAFNVILNKKANFKEAVGVFGPDGRAFFIVPRDGFICVGTWYEPFEGLLEDIAPTKDELNKFISSFNQTDLNLKISLEDIKEADAGIMPMKGVGKTGPMLFGLEKIIVKDNYAQVLSTKYTTFLSQGKKVVKKLFCC